MKSVKRNVYAIDARMIEASGIGTYIRMMLRTGRYSVALGNTERIRKYDQKIEVIPFEEKIYGIKEQVKYPYGKLKKKGVTVLHSPHYNIPLLWNRKLIVTIHDLIHIKFPQYLPNKFAYIYAWTMLKFACIRAEKVLTVSEFTKQDLIRTLYVRESKIEIIYNEIESCFKKKEISEVEYLKNKYDIPKDNKIVLYVGNIKPHKNVEALINAFFLFEMNHVSLALVGKDFNSSVKEKLLKNKKTEGKVIMTGAVSKDELVDWYNLSDVFVFPSLYEGFGIPPIEAMACGTPVICSSSSSLPEVVGDASILVNPTDIDAIHKEIQRILAMTSDEKSVLIEKGYKRAELFRNEGKVEWRYR